MTFFWLFVTAIYFFVAGDTFGSLRITRREYRRKSKDQLRDWTSSNIFLFVICVFWVFTVILLIFMGGVFWIHEKITSAKQ